MGQERTLIVASQYDQVKRVCRFVASGAEQVGLDEDAVFHVELACDEACTNIIEHAYGEKPDGEIRVSWQVKQNDFIITIHDNGRSFDPDAIPNPAVTHLSTDDTQTVADLKVGGLGVYFMRKLMDDVTYEFDASKGNTLMMVKRIKRG